jgi:anti-sigma factor RsiW
MIQESLGVYALDSVDPEMRSAVERHLGDCVKCSIEVAHHHEVAGLLANSGGPAPAGLWEGIASQLAGSTQPSWERLFERIDEGVQDPRIRVTGDLAPSDSFDARDLVGAEPVVVPMKSERRSKWKVGRRVTGIAAAAVAAILLGAQVDHLNHQISALQNPSALTQAEQAALEAPSTKQILLTVPAGERSPVPEGRVTVVLTKSGTGFVEGQGLSSLPRTETYQLWGVVGSQTVSLGLLGSAPTVVPFSVDGDVPVEAFAITAENAGGVVQSSNQPVVAGEVTT